MNEIPVTVTGRDEREVCDICWFLLLRRGEEEVGSTRFLGRDHCVATLVCFICGMSAFSENEMGEKMGWETEALLM